MKKIVIQIVKQGERARMDDLEQLKNSSGKDFFSRKELEEYVNDLTDAYIEKADYRRTKLFKQIENIYFSFPLIQSIAKNYVNCFVMLDGNYKGKKGKTACETIAKIFQHFPDDVEIAQDYTFLLMMYAEELDSIECKKIFDNVNEIYKQFPDNDEIKENLIQIQESYKTTMEYERLSAYTELLKQKVCNEPDSTELIYEYINALTEYAQYVGEEECDEIKMIVYNYCNQFPDNIELKQKYANINKCLIKQTDEKKASRLLIEIESIYKENPSVVLAIIYAEALCEILCLQNSKHKSSLKELKNLYDNYPDNSEIVAAYACGLYTLIEIQEERAAKKTLLEMFSLAEKYPNNSDLLGYLEDAKNSFAYDYEDAVFWETSKAKTINTNCFAVLDTETTWNNKVMTIGVVIADKITYQPEKFKYYVITPEYQEGGMYSTVASLPDKNISKTCSRDEAIQDLGECFKIYGVNSIYAYNMAFDRNKLPELEKYSWFDITAIASNRQYNKCIPYDAECYQNGRLKRGYGVESIVHMLSRNCNYQELHNALFDAMDELKIMQYLRYSLESYKVDVIPVENPECVFPSAIDGNDYKIGDRICHKVYGHGLILECRSIAHAQYSGYWAVTCFIKEGTKTIMVPFNHTVWKEL